MSFSGLAFADSGMYQCVAENRHGVLHANAELRVFGESKVNNAQRSTTLITARWKQSALSDGAKVNDISTSALSTVLP